MSSTDKFDSLLKLISKKHKSAFNAYLAAIKAAETGSPYQKELSLDLKTVDSWTILGGCLVSVGLFSEAVEAYKNALEIDCNCASAHHGLAIINRSLNDKEIERLNFITKNKEQDIRNRISANLTLGKIFDKDEDYDSAYHYFIEGNTLAKEFDNLSGRSFNKDDLCDRVDRLISNWSENTFDFVKGWGNQSELPVFVVGMPRSGTTLVEQILASHSQVFGAGECSYIEHIIKTFSSDSYQWDKDAVRLNSMGHISKLKTMGGSAIRVVDKMPNNIFWLGAIATLFPKSRVIICRRDFCDTCWSCFCQNFGIGYSWSHDLEFAVIRAKETDRLISHWLKVLPLSILEIHYEDLVANQEEQSKRLINFLGLTWEENCLHFYKTERQILTASSWQVRQPLYTNAVGHWRNYEEHIGNKFNELFTT